MKYPSIAALYNVNINLNIVLIYNDVNLTTLKVASIGSTDSNPGKHNK